MNISASRARWIARSSLIAAFLCFTANCLSNRLLWLQSGSDVAALASTIVSVLTTLCVVAGVVCGVVGIVLGRRLGQPETSMLGAIGLILNLGILGITAWLLWLLRSAG